MPGLGLQIDGAADLLDVCLYHIQPDAAPGDVGDLFRGRETREEDEVGNFALRHPGRLVSGDQGLLNGFIAKLFIVQPGAIIGDLDVDLSALVKRPQKEQPFRILSCHAPHLRGLDAMIHRIAYQVGEWIFNRLDDGLVEFSLFALHFDAHLLAATEGYVAYCARELAPDIADRLHARLHHAFLQFGSEQVQPLTGGEKFAVFGGVGVLHDLVAQQNHLAHTVHEPVQLGDINPDRTVAGALPSGLLLGVQGLDNVLRFDGSPFDQDLSDMSRVTGFLVLDSGIYLAGFGNATLDENLAKIWYWLF